MTRTPARTAVVLLTLAALCAALVVLRLLLGATTTLGWPAPAVLELRAVFAASAVVVGAALATSGVLLQAVLRNPLASPWVLGLTSGAGLGVVAAVTVTYLRTGAIAAHRPAAAPALLGALSALTLVYLLAQRRGLLEPVTLVLVGVIVSVLCGAGSLFLQQMLPGAGLEVVARWSMGEIREDASWTLLGGIALVTAAGIAVTMGIAGALDAALLDDDSARSVGVRLDGLRLAAFLVAGVLTAGTVVLAGPIAFVGLVAPHVVRLLLGPEHRTLVIGAALCGALLLLTAETAVTAISLTALSPSGRIPVGVLTALAGSVCFLWLLRRGDARPDP